MLSAHLKSNDFYENGEITYSLHVKFAVGVADRWCWWRGGRPTYVGYTSVLDSPRDEG